MKKLIWPVAGALLMAALVAFQEATADKTITAQEWVQVLLQVLMAFNVWATANLPQYEKMKTYVAAAIAVVSLLVSYITNGIDTQEAINLAITLIAALGVALTPQPLTKVVNGTTVPPNAPVR